MKRMPIKVLKDEPLLNNIQVKFDFFPKNRVDLVLSQACNNVVGISKLTLWDVLLP
jgi:hypothetical protein